MIASSSAESLRASAAAARGQGQRQRLRRGVGARPARRPLRPRRRRSRSGARSGGRSGVDSWRREGHAGRAWQPPGRPRRIALRNAQGACACRRGESSGCMTATQPSPASDAIARRNVAVVLVIAQAVLGAQMPIIFTVGRAGGADDLAQPCWATLPMSMIVLGSVLTARRWRRFMQNRGPAGGLSGRHRGRRDRRPACGARDPDRFLRADAVRLAVHRDLHVGAGLLPLCRRPTPLRPNTAPRRFPG
jgi:hypothetical protein